MGEGAQHQCDAQLLCLDWEFLTGGAPPRGKEESSVPFIVVPVMLWAVFPGTDVNWEPCFTTNRTRSVSCGAYRVLDHLKKICSMKNLLELDLICCLDAPRMLQCVLLSSLQVPAHYPGRGQGLALFSMTQLVCTD